MIHKNTLKKAEWDSFVATHAPQSYFQAWNWGEIEKKSGKAVWRVVVTNKKGSIVGISQVAKIQARRGTFLHIRHGPIFAKGEYDFVFEEWLFWMRNLASREGALFLRISPLIAQSHATILSRYGFRPSPIHSMDAEMVTTLTVANSEQEILSGMRKTTRNLLRRGLREGIDVREADDIVPFLRLYGVTAKRHRFVPHSQVSKEYAEFKKDNAAVVLNGYADGRLVASAVVVAYANQAMYRHGASVPSRIPVSYMVQWKAIQWAKARGLALYNFWGISEPENKKHPWWGLTQFKMGFGGSVQKYLHAHDLPLTPLYVIPYAIESARKMRRGY